jgi:GNAT superfamily N-acetyltransferase
MNHLFYGEICNMKKTTDLWKRYGLGGILLNIICKCLKCIGVNVSFWSCYVQDVNKLQKVSLMPFKELHLSDFEQQSTINSKWFTADKLRDMRQAFLIKDNHAYGYYEGDILACYGWISLKQWGLDSALLMNDDSLFWDDYTHSDFRGRGLHKDLNQFRTVKAAEYGKKRVLTIVASYNRASRVGFERSGFVLFTRFVKFQLGKGIERTTLKYERSK